MKKVKSSMEVTLLGTGTSVGIPVIGCGCRVCSSTDPRDVRTRCSCHVYAEGIHLIIDTGPDFRRQALREGINHVDGVLFTHHHFDHVAGMDDLRPFFFNNRRPIHCFARANTADVLQGMFTYIFEDGSYPGVPDLVLHEVDALFEVESRSDTKRSVEVTPIEAYHGNLPVLGYRIGRFAYLTDTNRIPASSYGLLENLDVLVLDALREERHPTHFSIDEAVSVAERIGAAQTYFVHMTHTILHEETDRRLPRGMQLGFDGLRVEARM